MRVYQGCENLPAIKNPVVAIGSFDGVHRGHRLLISQLGELAAAEGGESVVVTFEPHPRLVLRGENRLLSTGDEKLILLEEAGARNVIVVNFTVEFSQISHTDFIERFIIGKLGTEVLVTGQEHHFGHDRGGDLGSVAKYGIKTKRLERYDNISSTLVRTAIESGRMQQAAELLGRRGYLVNTPITDRSKLLPPDGRYRVEIAGVVTEISLPQGDELENRQSITIIERI